MNQDWIFDPRLAQVRGSLGTDTNRAWLTAQKLRDDYGWKDPELGAIEHEAYMRRALDKYPASTALVGLPQTFGYNALKATAQAPWTQPLLYLASPGLRSLPLVRDLQRASPASWDQFGAGVKGYVDGLLSLLGD